MKGGAGNPVKHAAPANGPMPPAVRFVLFTLTLNAMGFGLIVPVVPKLIMALENAPIDRATAIGGMLAVTFALFQFVFSPILGNLSDRYGRRPVLLASTAGFAVDFLLMAIAPTLVWVFIARAFSGVFGASNGPAQSVIADVVPPEERSRYFGLLGAAFGLGFILGPAIGGVLSEFGYRVPFYAAAALLAANTVYGYFALPETLKVENRRRFEWRRANPVGALLSVRKLPGILPIALIYLLWQIATLIYPLTWPYFTIGRYGWSGGLVGLSLALVGAAMVVTQVFILPRMVARYGEHKTALIGGGGAITAMLCYAFIEVSWVAWLFIPVMAFQSLVHPNLTAMITRRARADNQGEVQGFASGVMAIGSIIAPLLFNPALAWFTGGKAPFIFWGAAFIIAAVIAAAAIGLLSLIKAETAPEQE
jgi:MFS transporter, DHA1 family, tetracycline resistance protein